MDTRANLSTGGLISGFGFNSGLYILKIEALVSSRAQAVALNAIEDL